MTAPDDFVALDQRAFAQQRGRAGLGRRVDREDFHASSAAGHCDAGAREPAPEKSGRFVAVRHDRRRRQ